VQSAPKHSVKLHLWYKPLMVSVNRKTVALKLLMVQVRECNFQTDVILEKRPVERLAFFCARFGHVVRYI
jgi:hypothetical protein